MAQTFRPTSIKGRTRGLSLTPKKPTKHRIGRGSGPVSYWRKGSKYILMEIATFKPIVEFFNG